MRRPRRFSPWVLASFADRDLIVPRLFKSSLALAALFAAAGCTVTGPSRDSCSDAAQCRAAFGAGSVCTADGYCAPAPRSARCLETYPEDLFNRPERYPSAALVGVLSDNSVETQIARSQAIRLVATQLGDKGGLDGKTLGLVFCDIAQKNAYDPLTRNEAAVASAKYLVSTLGVPAIVGPSSSPDTLSVFAALQGTQTLVISPAATSSLLGEVDTQDPTDDAPGLLWRTAPPDTVQGEAIARFFAKQSPPVSGAWVIHEAGAYGESLANVFSVEYQKSGGVATIRAFASATERDTAVIEAGDSAAPWVLFLSSQTADSSAFLNAAAALSGYGTKNVFLADAAANSDLLGNTTAATSIYPRVRGSRPGLPSGNVYEQFRASFNAAYSTDAADFSFVSHAYDAAWLVFLGASRSLKQEGSLTGRGIARGLRRIVPTGTAVPLLPPRFTDLAAALGDGQTVNVIGASGSLDFDPDTEETSGPIDIWRISSDGSSIEIVETDPN